MPRNRGLWNLPSGSLAGGGEVNINILLLWNSLHGFYEVPTFFLCPSPSNTCLFNVLPLSSDKIHHLVSTISYHLTSMGHSTWLLSGRIQVTWLSGEKKIHLPMHETWIQWARKIPWRRKWQPTPEFLPEKSYRQRSLAGYSPWGHKKSDSI